MLKIHTLPPTGGDTVRPLLPFPTELLANNVLALGLWLRDL